MKTLPLPENREIVYLIGSLHRGGTEIHLARIVPELVRRGWHATIFCLSDRGELADAVEANGVRVLSASIPLHASVPRLVRILLIMASAIRFYIYLLRRSPFLVHTFLPTAYWIGAPFILLANTRNRLMSRRSRNHYLENNLLARRWERLLHRHMTVLLGNSKSVVQDLLHEGAAPERVRLIYNGIPLPPQPEPLAVRSHAWQQFAVDKKLVICSVANLIPYKGHSDLIEAMKLVRHSIKREWKLLIAGRDDGIGASLIQQAKDAGLENHIQLLGGVGDVPGLLTASDIFVLPSHQEGFSNALLEAMAAGLAIVATRVGGNAEAIEDGVSGRIVPPGNPAALGQAILELAEDEALRTQMSAAALRRVREHFSLEHCIDEYDALYRSLA